MPRELWAYFLVVGDAYTALGHRLLNIAQAQREPMAEPHTITDDLHREAVPLYNNDGVASNDAGWSTPSRSDRAPSPANLMPSRQSQQVDGACLRLQAIALFV